MAAARLQCLAWLILLVHLATASGDQHIVLKPSNATATATLPEKMLVYIPGGDVPNDKYVATAQSIQRATEQHLRLWVVIPAVFRRLCIITCSAPSLCGVLHEAVEGALSLAKDQGWTRGVDSKDMWIAGHSLGGVCANTLFQADHPGASVPYAGMMVMGSYVDKTGAYDLINYPVPLLTLNTELDGGLARPGKTAVWWRQYLELEGSKGERQALTEKPVVVLPRMNHSNFCPGFDVPGDLLAEVDQVTATASIGKVAGAFLLLNVEGVVQQAKDDAAQLLQQKIQWTRGLMTPYLKAQEMERMAADTAVSAAGASPFCAEAQRLLSAISGPASDRLVVADGFRVASTELEHCHPNWTVAEGSSKVLVRTCSHTDYYRDIDNTGSITAASEIACKLHSADRIAQLLNVSVSQPRPSCKDGNRHAVELAESLAAPATLERFRRSGRGWCFLDDTPTPFGIGPVWIFTESLKLTENATCLSMSSPVISTALDGHIYPGSLYCKMLSPARALDWMMTDSLKHPKKEEEKVLMPLAIVV